MVTSILSLFSGSLRTTTIRRLWIWKRLIWIPCSSNLDSLYTSHKLSTTRTHIVTGLSREKGCFKTRPTYYQIVHGLGHFSTNQKKHTGQSPRWSRMAFEFIQSSPICKAALLTAGYQLMFFLPTAVFRMDKLTDFAGASNFAVLALWSYMGYSSFSTRQKWITSLLVLWSARLALYLGYRIWFVFGEDRRLDSFRDNIFKLMGFWTLQGLWAFVVSLPAVLCNMNSQIRPVGRLDYCGYTIFAIGFLCETIADFQKQYFKQRNPERWCDWGLWRYSRHPNYFGELLVWYGIYSLAWNGLTTFHRFIALSSPLLITWLLITVSGIPLLEKSADSKYGSLLEYQLYKKRTSILIPLPPQIVERWNRWIGN